MARGAALAGVAAVLAIATFARGLTYADQDQFFRDQIAKAPGNARGYAGYGLLMMSRGPSRMVEALDLFQQAAVTDSTYYVAWNSLGMLHLMRGHWSEAADAYSHTLRVAPNNADAIDGMARSLVRLKDVAGAQPYIDRLAGRDPELLWYFGDLLVSVGRGREAVAYLEPVVAVARPPALGLALLSQAYAQSGDTSGAINAAREATSNAGDTVSVFVFAGKAMLLLHRNTEARAFLMRALAIDPASVQAKQAMEAAGFMH
jgi:tetratricopeptide (TPR) repeat protein